MTPSADWTELKQLYDAALALPAAEREAWVRSCGASAELQAELLSLLSHSTGGNSDDPDFLAAPASAAGLTGQRLGPWLLIDLLGSGGMGEVWRARRADGAYEGEAAVKLLKRGMDSAAVLRRFAQERQALARLDHPNIGRLFDAGLSPQGLPYFVMEKVEGQAIDKACEARSLEQRLELFLQLTDAVSHAHRHLLVHRDLKPGNVLVTASGQVKLLDFGIAKALDPLEGDAQDAGQTQQGDRPYTPTYASPEQVRGEPVSTATDIYSLGVLLYQLLTGIRPYGRHAATPREAADSVLNEQPTRPSSLSPGQVGDPAWPARRRRLRGDLDNILLKTLEKDPARRYATVDALTADIRAHLRGYPVSARPASPAYLLERFVQRNRLGVGLSALALLALVGGLAGTLWQMHEAQAARAQAERRFAQLRQLSNKLVFSYHDQIAQLPGALATREALLKDALGWLDGLAGELGPELARDPGLARELAESYSRIAALQGDGFSPSQEQLQAAEQNIVKALALQPLYLDASARDAAALQTAGEMWQGRAMLALRSGQLQLAVSALEQARQLDERAMHLAPDDPLSLSHLATVTGRIGGLLGGSPAMPQLGEIAAAGPLLQRSAEMFDRLRQKLPADPEWAHQAAWSRLQLANWALLAGRLEEAEDNSRQMLALRDAAVKAAPENANYRYQRAMSRSVAARVLLERDKPAEALQVFNEGIALLQAEQARDAANKSAGRDLLLLRYGSARAAWQLKPDAASRAGLQQAALALPPSKGEDFYLARWRAEGLLWLARSSLQPAQALAWAREAQALMRGTHDSPDNASRRWILALLLGEQAAAHAALGEAAAARSSAQEALALWRKGPVPPHYASWQQKCRELAGES
ncbi:protein kinase [Paucibacter sp. JuS9]|uniref:protein kinase domain-containing protein n=1 Tax=Roseateles TaxID=93681 RepID=UPI002FE6AB24